MPQNEEADRTDSPAEKWQGIAAVLAIALTVGGFLYNQSQISGANSVTLQNHTAQIISLQQDVNNEQVMLSSINDQLAGLTQKIDDMQPTHGGH